jgi:hypothetical protein
MKSKRVRDANLMVTQLSTKMITSSRKPNNQVWLNLDP